MKTSIYLLTIGLLNMLLFLEACTEGAKVNIESSANAQIIRLKLRLIPANNYSDIVYTANKFVNSEAIAYIHPSDSLRDAIITELQLSDGAKSTVKVGDRIRNYSHIIDVYGDGSTSPVYYRLNIEQEPTPPIREISELILNIGSEKDTVMFREGPESVVNATDIVRVPKGTKVTIASITMRDGGTSNKGVGDVLDFSKTYDTLTITDKSGIGKTSYVIVGGSDESTIVYLTGLPENTDTVVLVDQNLNYPKMTKLHHGDFIQNIEFDRALDTGFYWVGIGADPWGTEPWDRETGDYTLPCFLDKSSLYFNLGGVTRFVVFDENTPKQQVVFNTWKRCE